jgi:hypothetical protein
MANYRAYTVGSDGRFIWYEPLICLTDDDAIAKASALLDKNDIAVWRCSRFLILLKAVKKRGTVTRQIKTGGMK